MRRFLPNDTKIFKLSELASIINDNTDKTYEVIRNTFSEGYLGNDAPEETIEAKIVTIGTDKYLGIYIKDKKFSLLLNGGVSEALPNKLIKQSTFFDEVNSINGTALNKIQIENKSLFVDTLLEFSNTYSSPHFYCLQLNGMYQEVANMLIEANNEDIFVGFTKVKAGAIYPFPKKLNGTFSRELVENTLTYSNFLYDFCAGNKDACILSFPYLNVDVSDKALVLEVTDSFNTKKYYHIPKDLPVYSHNAFFVNSDEDIYSIKISFGDIQINSTDKVSLYFASFAVPQDFSNNVTDLFVRKYRLQNFKNLDTDTNRFLLLLSLDEVSGTFFNLSLLNTQYASSGIDIELSSGSVEISTSLLPYPSAKVYFSDVYYVPPIQLYRTLDYVNNVTIYGYAGNLVPVNLGSSYNIYVKNVKNYDLAYSFLNSSSYIENILSSYSYIPKFLLVGNDSGVNLSDDSYIVVGTVTTAMSPETASLNISPFFTTPFERLQTIANSGNKIIWRNISIIKESLNSSSNYLIVLPLLHIPYQQKFSFKGFSFIGNVLGNSISLPANFTIRFTVLQNNSPIVYKIFPNVGEYNTGINPYIYEMQNLSNNLNYFSYTNNDVTLPSVFQVEFILSEPSVVSIESFVIFYELS